MKALKNHNMIRRVFLFTSLVLSLAAVASAQDRDDRSCSPATVAGRWGYTETGTVFLPTGPIPYASVGSYSIDEDGNLSGERTASAGGKTIPATIKGTATVDADCTGKLTLAFFDPSSGNQIGAATKFVVYDENATAARAIVTSAPSVLTTNAKKLFHDRACSNASVAGQWGYTITGTVFAPPTGAASPAAIVGIATFDEEGTLSATHTNTTGGKAKEETLKGTFTVSSDCIGTLSVTVYDQSGSPVRAATWYFVIDDYRRELRAIYTSAVVLGPDGTKVPLPVVITVNGTKLFLNSGHEQ